MESVNRSIAQPVLPTRDTPASWGRAWRRLTVALEERWASNRSMASVRRGRDIKGGANNAVPDNWLPQRAPRF
jgi:hypothetical protein